MMAVTDCLICPFERDAANIIAISSINLRGTSVLNKFFITLFNVILIVVNNPKL
jgi:hypothetical protein